MKYEFDVGYDKITNFDAPGYEPKEISTFLTRAQESIVYEILKSSAYDERNKKAISRLRQVIPLSTFTAGNYPHGYLTPLQVIQEGVSLTFTLNGVGVADTIGSPGADFNARGFRAGDVIYVADDGTNEGSYHIISISLDGRTLSLSPEVKLNASDVYSATITTDPVLRVRNERADIELIAGNFYYDKIVGNAIENVEVDPIDDDFYSANKDNPYKKPSIKKIWRIDGANASLKEHEYITDGTFTFTTVHLHIDRKPRPIIVPETTAVSYATSDGTIDSIWFVDFATGLDCLLDPSIHRDIVDKAIKLAYAALQDEKGFQISSALEQQE